MDSLVRSELTEKNTGLAPNDTTMLFPVAGAFLALSFYLNQQDRLIGPYLENCNICKDKIPRLIGSIPLRYSDPDNGIVLFRSVTETNKEWREKAIIKLIRDIHERGNLFQGEVKIISSEAVPDAMLAREERLQKLGILKASKKPKSIKPKETSVWVKKYIYESLFIKEIPNTRYLPISFLINTINDDGNTFLYTGGMERLTIESDVDILKIEQAENIAFRIYGTCIDTNWRNLGTKSPKRIHFIYTQDNLRKADIALLDKSKESNGKKLDNVTITSLAINLENSPITYSTENTSFLEQGLSLEVNQKYPNSVRLIHDQGSELIYIAQALKRIYPSNISYNLGNKQVKITGKIPLEINIDNTSSKVTELTLTSDNQFPEPNLDWTSVKLKGVMFNTKDLGTIYQDTSSAEWKIRLNNSGKKEPKDISPSTKINLLIFSKYSEKNTIEIPEKLPTKFSNFHTARYFQDVTFSLHEYNKYHAENPKLETKSPEIKMSYPKLTKNKTNIAYTFAVIFFLFFLLVWFRPNKNLVLFLGRLTVFFGFIFAAVCALSFFALRLNIFEFLQLNQEILFYFLVALLFIGSFSIISSLRFQRNVPSGIYLMTLLLLLGIFFLKATPISSKEELTQDMLAFKSVLIIMLLKSGLLFTNECFKFSKRSNNVVSPKYLSIGMEYKNPNSLGTFILILLIYPVYNILLDADQPQCDAYDIKKRWLENELINVKNDKLKQEYENELINLNNQFFNCDELKTKVDTFSGKTVVLIAIGCLFLYFIGFPLFIGTVKKIIPSKPIDYLNSETEDSRSLLIFTVIKTVVSSALLLFSAILILPEFNFNSTSDSVCNVVKENLEEFKEMYGTDLDKIFYNTPYKLSLIRDKFDALGCISEQNQTILGIVIFLVGIWIVSIITPPRFCSTFQVPSILQAIFFTLFVSIVGLFLSWIQEKDNLRKTLDINSIKVLNDFISILKPPV